MTAAEAKSRRRAPLIISAVALTAAAFGVGFAVTQKPAEVQSAEASGQVVTVGRAEVRPFSRHVPLSGEARPRKDLRVFAPASGVRILELLVEQGDMVKAGQPLFTIDPNDSGAESACRKWAPVYAEGSTVPYHRPTSATLVSSTPIAAMCAALISG